MTCKPHLWTLLKCEKKTYEPYTYKESWITCDPHSHVGRMRLTRECSKCGCKARTFIDNGAGLVKGYEAIADLWWVPV